MHHFLKFLAFLLCFPPVVLPAQAPSIVGFFLVDAAADTVLGPLADGDTLNLAAYATADFNILALTQPMPTGSVRFGFNGNPNFRTETGTPYSVFGDNASNFRNWNPPLGTHVLTGTPFPNPAGGGVAGPSLTITFTVVNIPLPMPGCPSPGADTVSVSGELKQWHDVILNFDGPASDEQCVPNPFLDFRLTVSFFKDSLRYDVPGYFAADGDAAQTGATGGSIWRCHFAPPDTGNWRWVASFRQGKEIAVSMDSAAGTATAFDSLYGSFFIAPTDKPMRDMRRKGQLQYVGQRYLRFAGTRENFLKSGPDAPENLLAYEDFDNTPNYRGYRKSWAPHANDWQAGDPEWQNGKGHGLIGAINYIASEEMNSMSFLTMNIAGDDRNVFPYVTYNANPSPQDDRLRFDLSKLAQWEIVFSHATRKGVFLHFKLQETENDLLLDNGDLGVERKLYYREMVARFGHHLALNWNLGEENNVWQERNDPGQAHLKDYARYLRSIDPYDHHIVLHTYPGQQAQSYTPFLGVDSTLTGVSLQTGIWGVHSETLNWIRQSEQAGLPWVVANDEQGPPNYAVPPDPGYANFVLPGNAPTQDEVRRLSLWGNLMAGGAGVEYYFGYSFPESDLTCQNWRSRDRMWDYNRYALEFFQTFLPFWEMESADSLVTEGYCYADTGTTYAVYLPEGDSAYIDLPVYNFETYWYNPRDGGSLVPGALLPGGTRNQIGPPPADSTKDWVVLIKRVGTPLSAGLFLLHLNQVPGQVALRWELQGKTPQIFMVERSRPGEPFAPLARLEADVNTFVDALPPVGRVRYRIKVVDSDGRAYYSQTRTLWLKESSPRMYPNPTADFLHLDLPGAGVFSLRLTTLNGKELLKQDRPAGNHRLDLSAIPAGVYLLEVTQEGRQVLREKVVRE